MKKEKSGIKCIQTAQGLKCTAYGGAIYTPPKKPKPKKPALPISSNGKYTF